MGESVNVNLAESTMLRVPDAVVPLQMSPPRSTVEMVSLGAGGGAAADEKREDEAARLLSESAAVREADLAAARRGSTEQSVDSRAAMLLDSLRGQRAPSGYRATRMYFSLIDVREAFACAPPRPFSLVMLQTEDARDKV